MNFYEKIKKEHLFIFLFILIALILFSYFDFGYTGLSVKEDKLTCAEQGYSCCSPGTGKGTNYFSLDNTCSQEKSCWSYCSVSYDNKNLITGKSIFTDVFDSISSFFKKLFKPSVGLDLCELNTCNYERSTEGRSQKCVLGNWQYCPQFTMCDQSDGECRSIQGSDPLCTVGFYSSCNPANERQWCFRYEAPTSNQFQRVWVNCPEGFVCGQYGLCISSTILEPPTEFTAIPLSLNPNTIRLNWIYGEIGSATGFKIYRKLGPISNFEQIATLNDITQRSYDDSRGLSEVLTYYYMIRAFNSNNNAESPNSNVVTVAIVAGTLIISSTPSDALVYVGRELGRETYQGRTPFNSRFVEGSYSVKLTKEGYRDHITPVIINPGQTTQLSIQLTQEGFICGNNIREGNEQCDGTDLNSQTCQTRGFTGGTLRCNSITCQFDTSQCTGTTPYTLTVTISPEGSGTVTSTSDPPQGNQISCPSNCLVSFNSGSRVTLVQSPNRDYEFFSWTGACSGTTSCIIDMDGNKNVNAYFRPSTSTFNYLLSVPGVTVIQGSTASQPQEITVRRTQGTAQPVTVTIGTLPSGVTLTSANPQSCTPTTGDQCTVVFTYSGLSASSGNYNVEYTGTSSGVTAKTGTFNLTVNQPPSGTPAAPSNLQATVLSSSSIRLNWNDNSNNEQGFRIDRASEQSGITGNVVGPFVFIRNVDAGVTTHLDNNLQPNTEYQYRVRSYNANGASAYITSSLVRTQQSGGGGTLTLTVNRQGTGVVKDVINANTINCGGTPSVCSYSYPSGTQIKLRPISGTFIDWGANDCSPRFGNDCVITLTLSKTVTATFTQQSEDTDAPTVTITSPVQGSTVNSPITLSATTNKSSNCKWSTTNQNYASMTSLLTSSNNYLSHTSQVTLTPGSKTLYVSCLNRNPNGQSSAPVLRSFTVGTGSSYALTVTKTGQGTITSSPTGISCGTTCTTQSFSYNANTQVTLTINAVPGYTISNVVGCNVAPPIGTTQAIKDITGFTVSTQTCSLTMNSAKSVSVVFSQIINPPTGTREICNNNIDDDNDKAFDELDTDCLSSAYVKLEQPISPKYFKSNSIAKQPWEDSQIDLRCRISQSGSSLPKAKNCIFAKVGNVNCELKDTNSDENIDFLCDVKELGDKNASCNIYNSCAVSPSFNIRHVNYTINVTQPVLCKPITGEDRIDVSDIELDANDYEINDLIESSLTITNVQEDRNADITVSMQLYDINRRKLIESNNVTKKVEGNSESEDYTLSLRIPSVEESRFKVYYKIFEKDKTNRICLQYKNNLEIEGRSSCQDEDDDGYDEEACGGDDCDDDDETINPGADEICTDDLDNDCNNLIDDQDPLCSGALCTNGDTRECSKGICAGAQTCENSRWGQCLGGQQAATEQCTNNLDDDCDGLTDNNDNDCVQADSDNDGLPDSWEMQYFGTLNYNEDDDPDDDGFTNLKEYDADTDPSDADSSPEEPSILSTIIIVIIVIVIALFLIWWFALKPKKPKFNYGSGIQQASMKKPFIPNYTQSNSVLVDYVKNSLRKGYTKEQIKKALLAKGWKNDEIEKAFRK